MQHLLFPRVEISGPMEVPWRGTNIGGSAVPAALTPCEEKSLYAKRKVFMRREKSLFEEKSLYAKRSIYAKRNVLMTISGVCYKYP